MYKRAHALTHTYTQRQLLTNCTISLLHPDFHGETQWNYIRPTFTGSKVFNVNIISFVARFFRVCNLIWQLCFAHIHSCSKNTHALNLLYICMYVYLFFYDSTMLQLCFICSKILNFCHRKYTFLKHE